MNDTLVLAPVRSLAVIRTVKEPCVEGVPLITPVDELMGKPAGSGRVDDTDQVNVVIAELESVA